MTHRRRSWDRSRACRSTSGEFSLNCRRRLEFLGAERWKRRGLTSSRLRFAFHQPSSSRPTRRRGRRDESHQGGVSLQSIYPHSVQISQLILFPPPRLPSAQRRGSFRSSATSPPALSRSSTQFVKKVRSCSGSSMSRQFSSSLPYASLWDDTSD